MSSAAISWTLWWNLREVVPLGPELSAVAYALLRFGTAAFNSMRHHLESEDAVTRLCALAWAGHVLGEELIPWLGRRIFDVHEPIRDVATELLFRRAECGEEYEAAVSAIRATARVHRPDADVRALAIRALGQLRDVKALGVLIDLVGDFESSIAAAARDALITITGQALGASPREWWAWVDSNGDKDRVLWLIDGLNGDREEARQRSAQELERLTNHYVGYHAALPPKQRDDAKRSTYVGGVSDGPGTDEIGEATDPEGAVALFWFWCVC